MLGCAAGVRSTGYTSEGVSLWNFLSSIADLQMYKLLQDLVCVCAVRELLLILDLHHF